MSNAGLEVHRSQSAALEAIRSIIDGADDSLIAALPTATLSTFAPQLRAAIERDVLVLLLLHGERVSDTQPFDAIATVVRTVETGIAPLLVTADVQRGLTGHHRILTDPDEAVQATAFDNRNIAHDQFTTFLGTHWQTATERYVADVCTFPQTFSAFQFAVLTAALALREGIPITATADVVSTTDRTETTVSGPVTNVRQSIVYPASSTNPAERSLTVETGDGPVTLGGAGAAKETYECREITLERTDGQ